MGNLLWLSAFAIPRAKQCEEEAIAQASPETVAPTAREEALNPANSNQGRAGGDPVAIRSLATIRSLRLGLIAMRDGASLMNAVLAAMARALEEMQKFDLARIGSALCACAAEDRGFLKELGPATKKLSAPFGGPRWPEEINSNAGIAGEIIRALLGRRFPIVSIAASGALAAIALIAALI